MQGRRRAAAAPGGAAVLCAAAALLPAPGALGQEAQEAQGAHTAVFAGGCFWCMEQAFEEETPGVIEAVSGYTGGDLPNPTYQNHEGHIEAIRVEYDPARTSWDQLLEAFWRNVDPLDGNGQFCDQAPSYRAAVFVSDAAQRATAESSIARIAAARGWVGQIKATVRDRKRFWDAEEYHQDYYKKKPGQYHWYKTGCRRAERLRQLWGAEYEQYHAHSSASTAPPAPAVPLTFSAQCTGAALSLAPGAGDGDWWRCKGGYCVAASRRCDGSTQCADGSDEQGCTTAAPVRGAPPAVTGSRGSQNDYLMTYRFAAIIAVALAATLFIVAMCLNSRRRRELQSRSAEATREATAAQLAGEWQAAVMLADDDDDAPLVTDDAALETAAALRGGPQPATGTPPPRRTGSGLRI